MHCGCSPFDTIGIRIIPIRTMNLHANSRAHLLLLLFLGNSSGGRNSKVTILNNIASKWTSRSISFRECLLIYLLNLNRVRNLFFLFNTKVDPQILLLLTDCISGNIRIRTHRLEVIDTLLKKWRKNFLRGCEDIYFCTPALTHSMTMCVQNGIRNANLVYFPSINLCYCALVFLFFIRSFRHNSKRVWVVV